MRLWRAHPRAWFGVRDAGEHLRQHEQRLTVIGVFPVEHGLGHLSAHFCPGSVQFLIGHFRRALAIGRGVTAVHGLLSRFRFGATAAERGDRLDGLHGWLVGDRAPLTAFQKAHQVTHGAGHRGVGTPETVGSGLVFGFRCLGEAIESGVVGTDDLCREHLFHAVAGMVGGPCNGHGGKAFGVFDYGFVGVDWGPGDGSAVGRIKEYRPIVRN